ncbi:adenine phosphoribosyltransferase [Fulvivirga sedimenti]|jgi:adenine phosphoribosyltransferase|uniref:Adenine phosphoribosyltransferase n=1 Tax=Fulvivirga sedimenti TaxID=2879465 RepID=A0A9X1HQM1_9BACT|nr:adenine phosphoribosyltransferase [Fulvivirga sedimenti]MCA6075347.1 adenine phosphoribosyltransferase [Fulvivirga sedimenti]MCA6076524.1 adenine phosphoribosyltransferase [Fulvivirga sedimenti]MCA6077652.1 adenine phosphoribosyltransferase [Fulvivirga sedimenti]
MKDLSKIKGKIRDIRNFPKEGIVFKDITPLLADHEACAEAVEGLAEPFQNNPPDAIAGIESRGFLFGMLLAMHFGIPFIPVRKSGKLPYEKISHSYSLEYGEATIEIHTDAVWPGCKVLIHDDLLATGGTAAAAANLIEKLGGVVHGYSFLIELEFLNGSENLTSAFKHSLIRVK